MKASINRPLEMPQPTLVAFAGTSRRLLVTVVLAVSALGIGAGFALWGDGPPSTESSGSSGSSGAANAAAGTELPPGWTNAVEECDCLFGGQ